MRCIIHVTVRAHMCTNAIVKDKIVKFSKNCGTFTIKES